MNKLRLALIIAASIPIFAIASPHADKEHNFEIDVPDNWHAIKKPQPAFNIIAVQSPDQQKILLVSSMDIPPSERFSFSRGMFSGVKEGLQKASWHLTREEEVKINDLTFHSVLARGEAVKTTAAYVTSAGEYGYCLQIYSDKSEASNDAELQSVIKSFRLLAFRQPNESTAYDVGFFIGRHLVLFAVILLGFIGFLWFILRKWRKRRNVARSGFPRNAGGE